LFHVLFNVILIMHVVSGSIVSQKKFKDRLQILQNKCIRFVLNLDSRSHLDVSHFKRLNWLPFQKRVDSITLSHVYKVKHKKAPEYLYEHFTPSRLSSHIQNQVQ